MEQPIVAPDFLLSKSFMQRPYSYKYIRGLMTESRKTARPQKRPA